MIFEELRRRGTPYSVVRFTIQSMDDKKVVYQILIDYTEDLAAEFMQMGFHRERLKRFRNRYMWRPLTGRELARFLEARYSPVYQDGENMIWNFLGGIKRRKDSY